MSPPNNSDNFTPSQLRRKIRKPLIEKKRRERINDSLNQLKSLLLSSLHKDSATWNKMDKADILELAVHHMQTMSAEHMRQKSIESNARLANHAYSSDTPTLQRQSSSPLQSASNSMPSSPNSVSPCSSRSSTPEYTQHTQFFPRTPATVDYRIADTPSSTPTSVATPMADDSMWRPW